MTLPLTTGLRCILRCTVATIFAFVTLSANAKAEDWHTEVVDSEGTGAFTSLALDRDGNAHVSFVTQDGNKYPLKYGFWDQKLQRWFVMSVAEGAASSALALDSKQRPHIAVVDFGTAS